MSTLYISKTFWKHFPETFFYQTKKDITKKTLESFLIMHLKSWKFFERYLSQFYPVDTNLPYPTQRSLNKSFDHWSNLPLDTFYHFSVKNFTKSFQDMHCFISVLLNHNENKDQYQTKAILLFCVFLAILLFVSLILLLKSTLFFIFLLFLLLVVNFSFLKKKKFGYWKCFYLFRCFVFQAK